MRYFEVDGFCPFECIALEILLIAALLKLRTSISFNLNVRPACQPEERSYTGDVTQVSGWGTLQYGEHTKYLLVSNRSLVNVLKCSCWVVTWVKKEKRVGVRDNVVDLSLHVTS